MPYYSGFVQGSNLMHVSRPRRYVRGCSICTRFICPQDIPYGSPAPAGVNSVSIANVQGKEKEKIQPRTPDKRLSYIWNKDT